jgi:hypothetical protein
VRAGPDPTTVPEVRDPPDGFEVRARAGIDLVVALLESDVYPPRAELVPGTSRTFTVGYKGPGAGDMAPVLLALSVPGAGQDLEAARYVRTQAPTRAEEVDVDGRDGLVLTSSFGGGGGTVRRVLTPAPDGSLLVVTSRPALPVAQLVDVAAGIEPVDRETWAAEVRRTGFGPELEPDPGAVRVAEGVVDGMRWLVQAVPVDNVDDSFPVAGGPGQGTYVVDPCPKLEGGRRPCQVQTSLRPEAAIYEVRDQPFQGALNVAFLVGAVPGDVVRVRAPAPAPGPEAETVPVRGSAARAFVLAVEAVGSMPGGLEAVHADGSVTPLALP